MQEPGFSYESPSAFVDCGIREPAFGLFQVLGVFLAVYPMFTKVAQFIKDVQLEMGKVTWPTRDELIASTTIVLVVSLALSVFIFAVDFVLSLVRRFVMS